MQVHLVSNYVARKNISSIYLSNSVEKCSILVTMKILLKEYMNKQNLSFRQAEYKTIIPAASLHDIISGKTDPRMSVMEKIAKGLNTHIEDLYESEYK